MSESERKIPGESYTLPADSPGCADTEGIHDERTDDTTLDKGGNYSACTLVMDNESLSDKEDNPGIQDDDSSCGFVVIKPEGNRISNTQTDCSTEDDDQNVIFIQNSDGENIDGIDPDVFSRVQKVLAESGTESSVVIVNEDDENRDNIKTTTYIIDLNTSSIHPITSVNPTDIPYHKHEITLSSPTTLTSSSTLQTLVSSTSQSASKPVPVIDVGTNLSAKGKNVVDNLAFLPDSVSDSLCTKTEPTNLNKSSHINSSSSSRSPDQLTSAPATSAPYSSSVDTSQVAEQLMNIAKKMIEDSAQGCKKISVDESQTKIIISSPESKQSGDKSESVITMYLSSPNELKMKLKTLKTNSPVIVMQAGEEPSSSEDNKENPLKSGQDMDNNQGNIESLSSSTTDEVVINRQRSDSLVAALSSLTSGGVLYRCSECGYSSHNKHYYKQHVDLVHNEERPYKCPHCDYAGKRRHALLEHMVVHSNQRPFSCDHCNASFRKKGHLTNHVKLHMSHRLVHCGVCNIQLPDAEAFESHLKKIHNTDKLYKCKLCEHTLVERGAMLAHLATHNETIVFSCPTCSSYFNDEKSLLSHMKDVHDSIGETGARAKENDSGAIAVGKGAQVSATSTTVSGAEQNAQPANIVCSECGFICTDTQVMKKHMWVHIDSSGESSVQLKDSAAKKTDSNGSSSNANDGGNAMGVLKRNVVSGLKSLPENIVYQCTSCKFTSSDNSVFIKHMLLHKTQRKQQTPVVSTSVSSQTQQEEINITVSGQRLASSNSILTSTTVSSSISASTLKEKKPDSSVPFWFDQASGRYKCMICGYHCDFQRTIKAHIWKHSGNQNIEYPVFEQAKKQESTFNSKNSDQKIKSENVPDSGQVSNQTAYLSNQLQNLKTNSGRIIQLLPVNPLTTKFKPEELIQIKDNTVIYSRDKIQDSTESSTTVNPFSTAETNSQIKDSSIAKVKPVSPPMSPTLVIEDKSEVIERLSHDEVIEDTKHGIMMSESECDQNQVARNPSLDVSCTEPSVVVEIVDSVPPSFGLTGMKSQQGSPRVSDLEGSGNEVKLTKSFKEMSTVKLKDELKDHNALCKNSEVDCQKPQKLKYNLRKPKEIKPESHDIDNRSSRLKREHSDEPQQIDDISTSEESPTKHMKMETKEYHIVMNVIEEEEVSTENLSNGESDGTASSDDTASAGESGHANPPKSGICSSLLAVIEQLRERSRCESEKDQTPVKELPKRSSKRGKRASCNSEDVSLPEFHNIEKIREGQGEKFRCNLCHYTSQRICNMKIHMKTHRQKKPSECSLCDFASASPELLQEHMLQHCKVRTYACKFCPQSFNHKSTLRAHMRAHKDHEPFLCAYCVFETSNPNEYREHMHVHSGCSSRLRCPGCDYIMNSKDELTPHLMKCKGKTPESSAPVDISKSTKTVEAVKPLKSRDTSCDVKSTQALPIMTTETTLHSCVVSGCSFSSFNLKELQDHLSIHCNPSLMVCDLCDFKALHTRSLKSHMKRHANDQRYVQQPLEQYKCNLCGYVCHHLPSLKSHMWRHASDQSYSYEFTNDVINAAIDHDSRVDVTNSQPDDPELLTRFINSESRIMEGELTNFGKGDGQRPTCLVTFRCCSCGFETINKAKLNIHMRSHSDIIQQTLDVAPRKPGYDKSNHPFKVGSNQPTMSVKSGGSRRSPSTEENNEPFVPLKVKKGN